MPIRPHFRWEQTPQVVRVHVPLRGIARRNVDIYASRHFVKVNFAPYLLGLDLHGAIRDHEAKAVFNEGTLVMSLPKETEGEEWSDLEVQGVPKAELRARRAVSMAKREEDDAKLAAARKKRSAEASDLAFRRHLAMENAEREELAARKDEERKAAEDEVYKALAQVQREAEQAKAKAAKQPAADRKSAVRVDKDDGDAAQPSASREPAEPAHADDVTTAAQPSEAAKLAANTSPGARGGKHRPASTEAAVDVPAPRQAGRVAISFTERHFPTPLRQSKQAEEQDWLARNKHLIEARKRAIAADSKATPAQLGDISKRNPDWLKSKADSMFRAGDVVGAANTYSEALKRDPVHLESLGNRAVCHLRLGHDLAAALDCTTALMLLPKPPVEPAPPLPPPDVGALRKSAAAAAGAANRAATTPAQARPPSTPAAASAATAAASSSSSSSSTETAGESAETRADRLATIAACETLADAERLLGSAGVSERPELAPSTPRGPRLALQKALTRRATAWMRLGQFARAAADYQALVECAQRDPGAQDDAMSPQELASAYREDAALADRLLHADTAKRQADERLRAKDAKAASKLYDDALAIEPAFVPALVNRATARAAAGDLPGCVADCTAALASLGVQESEEGGVEAAVRAAASSGAQGAFVPCWGSPRLSAWVRAAALRRAAARMKAGQHKLAAQDFRRALETDPLNPRILRDMQQATAAMLVASGAVRETTIGDT